MDKYAKNKRWRDKCVREGRCPHCGQPCAPYYECATRRFHKKLDNFLRRLLKAGVMRREGHKYFAVAEDFSSVITYNICDEDRRHLPRRGNHPMKVEQLLLDIIVQHPNGITEDNIRLQLAAQRLEARP